MCPKVDVHSNFHLYHLGSHTKCSLGTAFGYADVGKATTLDTQGVSTCKRWGWYSNPKLAELQSTSGVTGTPLVGAGGNDVPKATNVGTYMAKADASGKVTVTYNLSGPYTITEAHVDLDCLPIDKCAPSQYTFESNGLKDLSTYTTTSFKYPTCTSSSKAYLSVYAAVDVVAEGKACPTNVG